MTWSELSNFLNSQRLALVPRPISEFAQIGEKVEDTFKRLEKTTREPLGETVRGFAKTKTWPALTDEQVLMLYFRLGDGVDSAVAVSACTTGLFLTLVNRDAIEPTVWLSTASLWKTQARKFCSYGLRIRKRSRFGTNHDLYGFKCKRNCEATKILKEKIQATIDVESINSLDPLMR